jgi:hypothetical protein
MCDTHLDMDPAVGAIQGFLGQMPQLEDHPEHAPRGRIRAPRHMSLSWLGWEAAGVGVDGGRQD